MYIVVDRERRNQEIQNSQFHCRTSDWICISISSFLISFRELHTISWVLDLQSSWHTSLCFSVRSLVRYHPAIRCLALLQQLLRVLSDLILKLRNAQSALRHSRLPSVAASPLRCAFSQMLPMISACVSITIIETVLLCYGRKSVHCVKKASDIS